MRSIQNLRMRSKLLLLIIPSLLAVLFFSLTSIINNYHQAQEGRSLHTQANFTLQLGPLIESLQLERGLSAVAIAEQFSSAAVANLRQQRATTDQALRVVATEAERLQHRADLLPRMRELMREYLQLSTQLQTTRQRIDQGELNRQGMITRYTDTIAQLTAFAPYVIRYSTDVELANLLTAYYMLTDAAEMAGRERATGAVMLGLSETDLSLYQQIAFLVGSQQSSLSKAYQLIGGELSSRIRELDNHSDSRAAVDSRQRILDAGGRGVGISSSDWFNQTSARINVIYAINSEIIQRVTAEADDVASSARQALVGTVVFTIVLFALVSGLTWLIMRAINTQVNDVLDTIDYAMEYKDLSRNVAVNSRDELGRIGHAINALFKSFADALRKIDQTSVQLAAATEQTSSTAVQNTEQTTRQQQQVEQVATATQEMSTTSADISRNTQQVAEAATNATNSKNKGLAAVRESATSVDTLVKSVNQVGETIRTLESRSGSITSVIGVIKNVAEQTNLLALNAAIEAARAGEHGRGFAVVADEVRKLAQQTHSSTAEIEDMLSGFQSLTRDAFQSINQSQAVAEATKEQVSDLNAAFAAIDTDVADISGMATQIATAAEQQVAVTREIAQNMESVSEASLLTLTGSKEITAVTEEQAKLARILQDLALQFKTQRVGEAV